MRAKYLIFVFAIFLVACGLLTPLDATPTDVDVPTEPPGSGSVPGSPVFEEVPLRVGYGAASSLLEIYFTDPTNNNARSFRNGPDTLLARAIDDSEVSVDIAAYSINLWSIRDALIDAHRRGVEVRMVMESENIEDPVPQDILGAGIPIVGDEQDGLMHDKFVVIDRHEVWTGSMNFTTNGAYQDNNNLIRIRSEDVAADYTKEFNEMFEDHFFGPNVVAETLYPSLNIDGMPVEIYFSPDDGAGGRINALLDSARESIFFMAYSFTSDTFALTILNRWADGVTIMGVMDAEQINSNQGTEYDRFQQSRLDVFEDGNPGLMHHKVFIIDRKIVITGSYNFSASAEETNDENIVIIFSPAVAELYLREFERVMLQAQK